MAMALRKPGVKAYFEVLQEREVGQRIRAAGAVLRSTATKLPTTGQSSLLPSPTSVNAGP